MLLKNAQLFDEHFHLIRADLRIDGECIAEIASELPGDGIDYSGCVILPGLIDIHIHGCKGADFSDATASSLDTMSNYLAGQGITSFCPTSMTAPEASLTEAFRVAGQYRGQESGAYIQGINMEGPYISVARKGAQPEIYIRNPNLTEFHRLAALCPISLVDVAPELSGAFAFAEEVSKECTVSIAHSAASYETATECLAHGFSHATHLFNGMGGIFARQPGIPVAILDDDNATAELICDGRHISPALLRIAFRQLGEDRTVVVSDAMQAAGLGDGQFSLGGQTVYVKNGYATLADGSFAASTTNLFQEFCNLLDYNIPLRQAVKSCTINPARVIGADKSTGSIAVGKYADLLILDASFRHIQGVFIRGTHKA